MFCYRDMTFCRESTCVNFSEEKCYRALTKERIETAQRWWKDFVHGDGEVPICTFIDTPTCFKEQ